MLVFEHNSVKCASIDTETNKTVLPFTIEYLTETTVAITTIVPDSRHLGAYLFVNYDSAR